MICPTCKQSIACPACAADLPNTSPAVRQPISETDLELMWGKAVSGEGRTGIGMYQTRLCALDFARSIEVHHGITGDGNG